MDKQLRNLKKQFESEIPTSFTERDKKAVFQKINKDKIKVKKESFPFLPKPIMFAVVAILLLAFGGLASKQFGIIDFSGGDSTDMSQQPNGKDDSPIIDPPDSPIKKDNNDNRAENEDGDVIFNPSTIRIGDKIGDWVVSKIEDTDDGSKISFSVEGKLLLMGSVKMNSNGILKFYPDKYSRKALPITGEEDDDLGITFFQNEKMKLVFNLNTGDSAASSLYIEEIVYTWGTLESALEMKVDEINPESLENQYESTPYNTTIELSRELNSIYKEYAKKKNDMILRGYKPIDIFKLYYHAISLDDEETLYALFIKGDKFATPDKDSYFNDPFFAITDEAKANRKEFYEMLTTVHPFTEVYISENETVISFKLDSESYDEYNFRVIKDPNTGVWKVSWLPYQ